MLRTTGQSDTAKIVDFSGKNAGLVQKIAALKAQDTGGNSSQDRYNKALRTVAVLQTTLELEQLTRLFSREVSATVAHSSINYCNRSRDIDLTVGRSARYTRTFRLIVENQELGQLTFSRGKPFTHKDAALLEFLLSSLVYPLRNALQYKNAFQASLTDPLTGVYNRSVIETALRRETSLARRHKTPLSLVLLDIDGLKIVNDEYGHEMGDNLIKAVADCVLQSLRKTDIFSRFGGDEFAILLSSTARRGAIVLAEHIRKNVEGAACMFGQHAIMATVSMGVASLASKDSDKTFFSRADAALYRAKRAGRNSVKVARAR
ncbi:MAG: GGDEF domain-containing protein [Acidiferrobacterales bacterium]|jgi:diguanylate cyclase (GGDEF)-like protein